MKKGEVFLIRPKKRESMVMKRKIIFFITLCMLSMVVVAAEWDRFYWDKSHWYVEYSGGDADAWSVSGLPITGVQTINENGLRDTSPNVVDHAAGLTLPHIFSSGIDITSMHATQLNENFNALFQSIKIAEMTLKNNSGTNSGLIAHYPFDGNANDQSGYNHHGTIRGDVNLITDRFGKPDKAYNFDGVNGCILVNDSDVLDIENNFTMMAWIRSYRQHNVFGTIMAKHFSSNARSFTLFDTVQQSPNAPYNNQTGLTVSFFESNNSVHFAITNSDYDNNWHFVASVYDYVSGNLSIYVDGVQSISNNAGQVSLMKTSIPFSIGCYLNSSDGLLQRNFFNGIIDDVRLYNRALSSLEIKSIYNAEKP